jgi:hypothetical protein
MTSLERGLYEVLITEVLEKQLGGLDAALEPIRSALRAPEAADRIALHLARVIERAVNSIAEGERTNAGLDLARRLIDLIRELPSAADFGAERPVAAGDVLQSVASRLPDGRPDTLAAPMIPLLDATLRLPRPDGCRTWRRANHRPQPNRASARAIPGTAAGANRARATPGPPSEPRRRYQNHTAQGSSVMLFARRRSDERAFYFLGPATYVKHESELPMAITWRLRDRW